MPVNYGLGGGGGGGSLRGLGGCFTGFLFTTRRGGGGGGAGKTIFALLTRGGGGGGKGRCWSGCSTITGATDPTFTFTETCACTWLAAAKSNPANKALRVFISNIFRLSRCVFNRQIQTILSKLQLNRGIIILF